MRRYLDCPECGRRFDITHPDDMAQWEYGHDCEPPECPECDGVSMAETVQHRHIAIVRERGATFHYRIVSGGVS